MDETIFPRATLAGHARTRSWWVDGFGPLLKRRAGDFWIAAGLAIFAALLWGGINGRFSPSSWRVPVSYSGDSLEVLAHMQAAAEWGAVPIFRDHIDRLGAPFGASWSEYPAADDVLMLALGQLSRFIGLGGASNLALILAQVTAVWTFYFSARYLRCRREWAAAGALLFAFSYHNVSRNLPHLSLVLTYTVPLALLSAWLIGASSRLRVRSFEGGVCLGAAVLIGLGNPYNLFLYLQLVGWAIVAQLVRARRWQNVRVGLAAAAVALGAFFLENADVWLSVDNEGAAPLMARNYGGTEQYSLKPIELILPPNTHRFQPLAFLGSRYLRWSDWRGEVFSPYLGIVGAAGLLWLLVATTRRLLQDRAKVPGAGWQALWILAFSATGGVNSMLAFFLGLQIFRATNRYSIFLLALGLMFLAMRGSSLTRKWPRMAVFTLVAFMTAVGLLDQIPIGRSPERRAEIAANFEADRKFGNDLEGTLPRGAMLFQLPFVEFPEPRPVQRLSDYELFRPYLHTKTLRFTYGSLKGRARGRWYREYGALKPAELVAKLENNGFAAIYINRLGYYDRAEGVLAAFAAAGRTERIEGRLHQQVVVRLHPAPHPSWPMADNFTFGQGWNPADDAAAMRWAYGPAAMAYFNPYSHPIAATVQFRVSGQGPRHLTVALNRRTVIETAIGGEPGNLVPLMLELDPGINRLDLSTPEPPERVSEERGRLRAFGVRVVKFQVEAPDIRL